MDLDRFKQINDTLGHAKGDEALVEFAVNLREVFRKDALLVRMGGDEFLAMGIESRPGQVEDTLQALDVVLSVRNMQDNIEYQLESSRGIAFFGRDKPVASEELLAAADAALYQNKQERKRAGGSKPSLPFQITA
jgi:diguanylate cyclase (GGDEF)-like protein